ncbi:MAG TPA: energy-coupling factor transporter transmembrane component T [Candidatus Limnocylindria bacterium]|nr:energy-coupling factor transporter transmembrane component T [Candidatus Limnocylindria bacterium]
MQLFTPLTPDPTAPLARANAVAKLAAAGVLMLACFLAVDLLTPVLILAVELLATLFSGLSARALVGRAWPLLIGALGIGLANALFPGEASGTLLISFGPIRLTTASLLTGLGLALRLLGIAFAGVLALATTDPTDLAESLAQQLHLSPRFAIGALAAVRLLPLLGQEWQTISLARRARGVDAGGSPAAAVRLFAGMLLALLVAGIRRGTRLAMAMDARGFGARDCRTWSHPQRMSAGDWWLVVGALAIAAGATAASVAIGSWRFLFG